MQPAIRELVLHWGEMGAKLGISRTVARIHALLYFSPQPLAADEITELLGNWWRKSARRSIASGPSCRSLLGSVTSRAGSSVS